MPIKIFNYLISFQLMFGLAFLNGLFPLNVYLYSSIKGLTIIFYFILLAGKINISKPIRFRPIVFFSFTFYILYFTFHDLYEENPYYSLVRPLLIYIAVRFLISNSKNKDQLGFSLPIAISGSFIVLSIFLYYLPIGFSTNFAERPFFETMTPFYINGNTLAQMSIISILLLLEKLKELPQDKVFLIKFIIIPPLIIFVFVTQSISSTAFLLFIGIVLSFNLKKTKSFNNQIKYKNLSSFLIYFILFISVLLFTRSNIIIQFIVRVFTGGSFGLRLPLFLNSIQEFLKNPIFGNSYFEVQKFTSTIEGSGLYFAFTENHTYYTNILAIYGLVGFILMMLIFYSIFLLGFNKRSIYEKLLILFFFYIPLTAPTYFFLPLALGINDFKEKN